MKLVLRSLVPFKDLSAACGERRGALLTLWFWIQKQHGFDGYEYTKTARFWWLWIHKNSMVLMVMNTQKQHGFDGYEYTKTARFWWLWIHKNSTVLMVMNTQKQHGFDGYEYTKTAWFWWLLIHKNSMVLMEHTLHSWLEPGMEVCSCLKS